MNREKEDERRGQFPGDELNGLLQGGFQEEPDLCFQKGGAFEGLTPDLRHGTCGSNEARAIDQVAFFFLPNGFHNSPTDDVVVSAAPEQSPQVGLDERKETRTKLPIGGDPNAVAVIAEWLAHGADESDFTQTVFKPESVGRLRPSHFNRQ